MLSNSKKLQRTELMRLDAMKTFLEIDMSNRLRTAMLRKSRPFRGGFEIGQRLAYWRVRNTLDGEGPFAGYCQGVLIGMDPGPRGSLWIRNDRGRLVQVAREQARALEAEEAWMPGNSDFRLLRDAEQDLSEKHAVGQDQRQAAIQDADQPPLLALPEARSPLDAQGQPTASVSAPLYNHLNFSNHFNLYLHLNHNDLIHHHNNLWRVSLRTGPRRARRRRV